jgi:hypothetical protein
LLAVVACGNAGYFFGGEWALIILLSCLYGVTSGINVSYIALQDAIRQRKIVALHQGADVWLRIGLSVALLFLFSRSGCFALLRLPGRHAAGDSFPKSVRLEKRDDSRQLAPSGAGPPCRTAGPA